MGGMPRNSRMVAPTRPTLDQWQVTRQPTLKSHEAPDRAPPGTRPPCQARALAGRDLAARNGRQNLGQQLLEILGRV